MAGYSKVLSNGNIILYYLWLQTTFLTKL